MGFVTVYRFLKVKFSLKVNVPVTGGFYCKHYQDGGMYFFFFFVLIYSVLKKIISQDWIFF